MFKKYLLITLLSALYAPIASAMHQDEAGDPSEERSRMRFSPEEAGLHPYGIQPGIPVAKLFRGAAIGDSVRIENQDRVIVEMNDQFAFLSGPRELPAGMVVRVELRDEDRDTEPVDWTDDGWWRGFLQTERDGISKFFVRPTKGNEFRYAVGNLVGLPGRQITPIVSSQREANFLRVYYTGTAYSKDEAEALGSNRTISVFGPDEKPLVERHL